MNLLQTWFANYCETYLVEFPLLYLAFLNYFSCFIQDFRIRATKYKNICGGKYTRARARARAPLARNYTNRKLKSKDGTTSIKY